MSHIVYPLHYLVIQRAGIDWLVKPATWFYKGRNAPADPNQIDYEACYGISRVQIVIELFRRWGGKPGYYLVNLKDKKYYYCGGDWEDIKTTLHSLGIGAKEPYE